MYRLKLDSPQVGLQKTDGSVLRRSATLHLVLIYRQKRLGIRPLPGAVARVQPHVKLLGHSSRLYH